jgi:hypothetical protein
MQLFMTSISCEDPFCLVGTTNRIVARGANHLLDVG